jgi:hypothetical protein
VSIGPASARPRSARLLVTGDPINDDLVERLVDDVLVPYVSSRR